MSAKQGIDAALYRNTATWGTPTWVEITGVTNAAPSGGWNSVEIKTRASRVIFGAKVNIDPSFTFTMLCDDADAGYTALMTAWRSLTAIIDLMILDGDVTTVGAFGFRFEAQIVDGGQEQPTDNVLYRDFSAKPAIPSVSTNVPKYAEVTAGPTVTFTTI